MKTGRIICSFCLLLASLMTIYAPTAVLAQGDTEEEALTITTVSLPAGMVGEAYSAMPEATGGATPYTWSVSAGKLPAELSLNPATGKISGTPTESGTVNFTIKVTDSTTPAQEATEELSIFVRPEPTIEIAPTYPKLEAVYGAGFEFELDLKYTGIEPREFNLRLTAPEGWTVYTTPQFDTAKRISAIRLEPGYTAGNKIKLLATAPFWPLPEPGDYKITLEAISDEIKGSTELTATITAIYNMALVPTTERYNTTIKAGKDNIFSIEVQNQGTAAIDNITFSSLKPTGWTIEFTPEKIDSLSAIDSKTIDVNIKPPTETIAGDYQITIRTSSEQVSREEVDIRVTVETPTIWGWVGVGIIVLVIAGLAYIFMRFSRR